MWVSYAVVAAALMVVAGIGSKATVIGPWYRQLNKPAWNPPDWAFPVVWTTIYIFIIYSVGTVWNMSGSEQHPLILLVVGINFFLNLLWSVLFFTYRRLRLALLEVVLLWMSIIAMMIVFAGIHMFSALALLPYLIWVGVATILNLSIVRLNGGLRSASI